MSPGPVEHLLERLRAIAEACARRPEPLALIGLGSVGRERERLDAWSDLDFFLIVADGAKQRYIHDLDWMAEAGPVAWSFLNTPDGHKLLYDDGIFCELAVFEIRELEGIPFAEGQLVWSRESFPAERARPRLPLPTPPERSVDWCLGEALSNLLVGLARDARGEHLSALRFIQGYAVDRLLELIALDESPAAVSADPFAPERRLEQRHPACAEHLPRWLQGYERNRESALAILDWLEARYTVNRRLAGAIRCITNGQPPIARA
jgi:lincosamide nucleotidyltransferase